VEKPEEAFQEMIATEAWVLHRSNGGANDKKLVLEEYRFPELQSSEVLVAPIYGCWEGNMMHAVQRSPMDICASRGEERVVIGNAAAVRVIAVGRDVRTFAEGDRAMLFPNGVEDEAGYPEKIFAYDAPNTIGVLAKKTKLRESQLIKIPDDTTASLKQWAAFSLRYVSAWANWRIAYACWRTQMEKAVPQREHVVAWGGGVALAQLELAKHAGFGVTMITSAARRPFVESRGIAVIDRGALPASGFDGALVDAIKKRTDGRGAAIFIDHIGAHFRATIAALAREGVLATTGWRDTMTFPVLRAAECINRHIHVFTHGARYSEAVDALQFAHRMNWMPPEPTRSYGWREIPQLAEDFQSGSIADLFPIFEINA
jgi:NADPH:quinone reductase-like Zn-dependent oxidoreductase